MGQLKALLAFGIFLVGAYAAYLFFPPYMANYQFQDDLNTEVRFSQNNGKADDDIKAEIVKKAMDEKGSPSRRAIKITRFNKTDHGTGGLFGARRFSRIFDGPAVQSDRDQHVGVVV